MTGFTAYTRAATWLYGVLTSPPISGVKDAYELAAPEGVVGQDDTWIEFELAAPGDDLVLDGTGAARIWTEFAFLVRAIARGHDTAALGAIADAIDGRLHRASGSTADGQVISSTRSGEAAPGYFDQGVAYRSLEATYHLIVQPANP